MYIKITTEILNAKILVFYFDSNSLITLKRFPWLTEQCSQAPVSFY